MPDNSSEQKTILFVDDDFTLTRSVAEILDIFGYAVTLARSANEAETILKDGDVVDLLLTDITFAHGANGFELAAQARILRPGLPVLYVSGNTEYSKSEMGSVQARILQKPFKPDELETAIAQALSD